MKKKNIKIDVLHRCRHTSRIFKTTKHKCYTNKNISVKSGRSLRRA